MSANRLRASGAILRTRNVLGRSAESSVVLMTIRRLTRESWACAAVAAVVRPSQAYLGGPVAPETDEEASASLARLSRTARASLAVDVVGRGVSWCTDAWSRSTSAAFYAMLSGEVAALDPPGRVRLIGWIVLVATFVAGVIKATAEAPWPRLSVAIWVVVMAGGASLIAGARPVSAAWLDRRASRHVRDTR